MKLHMIFTKEDPIEDILAVIRAAHTTLNPENFIEVKISEAGEVAEEDVSDKTRRTLKKQAEVFAQLFGDMKPRFSNPDNAENIGISMRQLYRLQMGQSRVSKFTIEQIIQGMSLSEEDAKLLRSLPTRS